MQVPLLKGLWNNGLHKFWLGNLVRSPTFLPIKRSLSQPSQVVSSILHQWHCRSGCSMDSTVMKVLSSCKLPYSRNETFHFCSSCELGKNYQLLLVTPLVQSWPMGLNIYVSFVDAFTRHTWIVLLKAKYEVFHAFVTSKTNVELQCNTKIKVIQTYWGGSIVA